MPVLHLSRFGNWCHHRPANRIRASLALGKKSISAVGSFILVLICCAIAASANSRGSGCKRTTQRLEPGTYIILVAGPDSDELRKVISNVVNEERKLQPTLFEGAQITVDVLNASKFDPKDATPKAIILNGVVPDVQPQSNKKSLVVLSPNLYEPNDPEYAKYIKMQTAGVHFALRSLLFFSGESPESRDEMKSDHLAALPDVFYPSHHADHK